MSSKVVMLLALISAFSRAGLNLIDRYQIGKKRLSISAISYWNSAIPAGVVIIAALCFGIYHELQSFLLDWRTVLFSGLVQLVAYAFSNAFRHLSVTQVTVVTKTADFFIPIAVLFSVGEWNWLTYAFSVATTLVCLPILQTNVKQHDGQKIAFALIIGSLVIQAGIAPLLHSTKFSSNNIYQNLLFASAVIVWRVLWCTPAVLKRREVLMPSFSLLLSPIFFTRVVLSIVTQVAFILAISNSASSIAWPILNSTGLIAMVLSSLVLNEKSSTAEKCAITGIVGISVWRFLSI